MTKRKRLLVLGGAALALALAAVLLVPACRWHVVGWARGEAFYRGRPTSYWRAEILGCVKRSYTDMLSPWSRSERPASFVDEMKQLLGLPHATVLTDLPFSPDATGAVPVLCELLNSGDPRMRLYAAWVLRNLGQEARDAIPALTEALDDHRGWEDPVASRANDPALPIAWTRPDWTVAQEASRALQQIDREAAKAAGLK